MEELYDNVFFVLTRSKENVLVDNFVVGGDVRSFSSLFSSCVVVAVIVVVETDDSVSPSLTWVLMCRVVEVEVGVVDLDFVVFFFSFLRSSPARPGLTNLNECFCL